MKLSEIDKNLLSPMMKEYYETKLKYNDEILLYRLGDFYEMFFEDAEEISRVLSLTLTGRSCGLKERAPMAGIPYHSVNTYIAKLVNLGYKVAVCDQLENPKDTKTIVKRGVTRIITPGTVTDINMLDDKESNYVMTIYLDEEYSISVADITTGEFFASQIGLNFTNVLDEVSRYYPKEIIISNNILEKQYNLLKEIITSNITIKDKSFFESLIQENNILEKEQIKEYYDFIFLKDSLNIENNQKVNNTLMDNLNLDINTNKENLTNNILSAIVGMINYLNETQKRQLINLNKITIYKNNEYMAIDLSSRKNLEINKRLQDGKRKGSLIWILDKTKTPMGSRLLSRWVNDPLLNIYEIEDRQDAVEELYNNLILRENISHILHKIYDIERIAGKIAYGNANAKDLISLKNSIEFLPEIKQELTNTGSKFLVEIYNDFDCLEDLYKLINDSILEEVTASITEGNIIKPEFNEELYRLKHLGDNAREYIAKLEVTEKEKTGIKNLKVGYNKVFGYFLEITNSNKDKVPKDYIRKQTLVNAERYVTPELKEIEEELLNAEEKIMKLEHNIFLEIRNTIAQNIKRLQKIATYISKLDVIVSLAKVAEENSYVKPKITRKNIIDIKEGRHPVVEKIIDDGKFVKNDCYMDSFKDTLLIITGPNMSGKSTFMRQIALISIMAQIGSFVPASSATIGIVDKVFTRIGASDDLGMGQSTFMVEMSEVANIINNATNRSLILLDEVGRGTSTYDGMSIAESVATYIADKEKIGARTLFATHYHELTKLEHELDGVKNYSVSAVIENGNVIFLRKLQKGGISESYGIHVAKLAGLPEVILNRANRILSNIKKKEIYISKVEDRKKQEKEIGAENINLNDLKYANLVQDIKDIDINNLTPIQAISKLQELKNQTKDM